VEFDQRGVYGGEQLEVWYVSEEDNGFVWVGLVGVVMCGSP